MTKYILILLILNGLFKTFKFGEPYFTPFLQTKSLTMDQINNQVYPIWTYSYMTSVVLAIFLSSKLSSVELMAIEISTKIVVYCLFVFTDGLAWMQLAQFLYGISSGTAFGYNIILADLFQKTPENAGHYDQTLFRWNSILRSNLLAGRVLASLAAQIMQYYGFGLDFLFQLSLGFLVLSAVLLFYLPPLPKKIPQKDNTWADTMHKFKTSYSSPSVVIWSLLWSINMCCTSLICNYGSSFWKSFRDQYGMDLNGVMGAISKLLGASGPFIIEILSVDSKSRGFVWMVLFSTLVLFASSFASSYFGAWPYIVILCWPLSVGLGYSICTLISGVIFISAKPGNHGFMLSFQLALGMLIQSILQLVLSNIYRVSFETRCLAVSGIVLFSVLFYPLLMVLERRPGSSSPNKA